MALVPVTLELLHGAFGSFEKAGWRSRRVLSLGPDLLASPQQLMALFGDNFTRRYEFRADSEQILRWHNVRATNRVVDTRSVFGALGVEVTDIAELRVGESARDINTPVFAELREHYRANPSQLA